MRQHFSHNSAIYRIICASCFTVCYSVQGTIEESLNSFSFSALQVCVISTTCSLSRTWINAMLPFNLMLLSAPSLSRTLVQGPLVTKRPLDVTRTTELEEETHTHVYCHRSNHTLEFMCLWFIASLAGNRVFHGWTMWEELTRLSGRWCSCLSAPGSPGGRSSWRLCSPPPSHHARQRPSAAPRLLVGTSSCRSPARRQTASHMPPLGSITHAHTHFQSSELWSHSSLVTINTFFFSLCIFFYPCIFCTDYSFLSLYLYFYSVYFTLVYFVHIGLTFSSLGLCGILFISTILTLLLWRMIYTWNSNTKCIQQLFHSIAGLSCLDLSPSFSPVVCLLPRWRQSPPWCGRSECCKTPAWPPGSVLVNAETNQFTKFTCKNGLFGFKYR